MPPHWQAAAGAVSLHANPLKHHQVFKAPVKSASHFLKEILQSVHHTVPSNDKISRLNVAMLSSCEAESFLVLYLIGRTCFNILASCCDPFFCLTITSLPAPHSTGPFQFLLFNIKACTALLKMITPAQGECMRETVVTGTLKLLWLVKLCSLLLLLQRGTG